MKKSRVQDLLAIESPDAIENPKLRRVVQERAKGGRFRFFGGGGYKENHNNPHRDTHKDYSEDSSSHRETDSYSHNKPHSDHSDSGYSETGKR